MNLLLSATAQPEFMPWGNVTGIRVDGEKVPFEMAVRAVRPDWSGFTQTSKYNWENKQVYTHAGDTYVARHGFEKLPLGYEIQARDLGEGAMELTVACTAQAEVDLAGLYLCVTLRAGDWDAAQLEIPEAPASARRLGGLATPLGLEGRGFLVRSGARELTVTRVRAGEVLVRRDFLDHPAYLNDPKPRLSFAASDPRGEPADWQIYLPLATGALKAGAQVREQFHVRVRTEVDRREATVAVDATQPGRAFTGIGGNFRLQFPDKDPAVVAYCLDHLRVTWGRIAMYWRDWQPLENEDPVARARAGGLAPLTRGQMELARTLAQRGIPIIVSVWDPPRWAADPWPNGERGEALKPEKLAAITESVARYLVYLKEAYGVEAEMFSFNETDVGVEVRETPADHARHARAFGAAFAAHGLKTKMLFGDTGHGTAHASELVSVVRRDPEARRYGGAVAFHTYHGCTPSDLAAWTAASRDLDLPLMVTEGGPDSAAHRYPQVFLEPWFAQLEADTYVRIAATCQPAMIMPWQLTSDYSVLEGEGIYGGHGPLRPTQRFWILKQLGTTPAGARWLPSQCDRSAVSAAAWTEANGVGVHLVNNGATRPVTLRGLPAGATALRVYRTDATHGMADLGRINVVRGVAQLELPAGSFLSLFPE